MCIILIPQLINTVLKLTQIGEDLFKEVNQVCEAAQTSCEFDFEQALTIENSEFSCDPGNRPLYRATARGTPAQSCDAFQTTLTSWIESGAGSVLIQGNRFSIADFCDVEIETFTDNLNCNEPTVFSPTTDEGTVSGQSLSSEQLVAVAGGLAGLIVLVVIIASVLFVVTILALGWRNKKKK